MGLPTHVLKNTACRSTPFEGFEHGGWLLVLNGTGGHSGVYTFLNWGSQDARFTAALRAVRVRRQGPLGGTRTLWSRSACRIETRSVSDLQAIFDAIQLIAAHSEACSPRCSNTIRTARDRTSGEYLGCLLIAPSSQGLDAVPRPGAIQAAINTPWLPSSLTSSIPAPF